jgi:transposase, IS5 family
MSLKSWPTQQVEPSMKRHKENFGRAPELYSSDRGFFSETNVKSCKQKGVKVVCIPQRGGKKTAKRKAYETRVGRSGKSFIARTAHESSSCPTAGQVEIRRPGCR